MNLQQKIKEDLKDALKKKDEFLVSVLRLIIAVFYNKELVKKTELRKQGNLSEQGITEQGQLTDQEMTSIISKEIKKRKDAISIFEKGKRQDLAKKEKQEAEILQKYLND
ncbi:GatB/YqeY domain-containing protein [Candidatus Parcubacteria bacterium]|nr:GatB/YqeY domain-containing protein [Candidatus Parcubacteria bacterium]